MPELPYELERNVGAPLKTAATVMTVALPGRRHQVAAEAAPEPQREPALAA